MSIQSHIIIITIIIMVNYLGIKWLKVFWKATGRKKERSGSVLPASVSPEGTLLLSHTPSLSSLSRISQLNIPGLSLLYCSILFSTSGVATCCIEPQRTQSHVTCTAFALARRFYTCCDVQKVPVSTHQIQVNELFHGEKSSPSI